MASPQSDPRVFFAAERTLLAWLRTGLTIIGLGFVIARFGFFIQLLGIQTSTSTTHLSASVSTALGVSFVVIGSLAIAIAAFQHKRFAATLSLEKKPETYSGKLAFSMALFVASLGAVLAVYLWFA